MLRIEQNNTTMVTININEVGVKYGASLASSHGTQAITVLEKSEDSVLFVSASGKMVRAKLSDGEVLSDFIVVYDNVLLR